ncbi:TonB-dependent receptor [Novosphingobium sp. PS1R-30]|uniref:TonB-dependent receptor n=1 Tax=Novosphingobium anseongense TaxID=3133436 RepID=A0ABU8S1C2_9SPHN
MAASPACAERAGIDYDMPAQPLASALAQAADRSSVTIIAPEALVEGLRSRPLKGHFSAEEAFRHLLEGSGLVLERVGESYVVKRATRSEVEPLGFDGMERDTDIVVTGSRIRGAPVASTLVRLEPEAIRNTGQASVADALRALPQNFGGGQNPGIAQTVPEFNGGDAGGGSGLNLRGLGADATLTLLNGHRLPYSAAAQSVDISAIPLDAVDRIEVVADGASAIYGSDAVAGVANIVLKRDFDGFRTRARVGGSTDGGNFSQLYSAVGGRAWGSGGLIVAYEFGRSTRIRWSDRDYAKTRSPGITLYPALKRHSLVVAGHQEIAPGLTFSIDGLYGTRRRDTEFPLNAAGNLAVSRGTNNAKTRTFVVAPSLDAEIGTWRLSLSGSYGNDRLVIRPRNYAGTTLTRDGRTCLCSIGRSAELGGDGPIFSLPGGDARVALGLGWRDNRLERSNSINPLANLVASQESRYTYGEINLPFVSPAMGLAGVDRLNLSAALRYENYPGIDEVVTPKVGLIYSPVPGFTLKGSWGKSFKAPTLVQRYQLTSVLVELPASVGGTGFPAGSTTVYYTGGSESLKPERATSWSATAVIEPPPIPGLRLEVGLFHTRYADRIVLPIQRRNLSLVNPAFADLVTRSPTVAQVNAVLGIADEFANISGLPLDPTRVVAIVNNSYANAASQTIEGVDFLIDYRFDLGGGTVGLTTNASLLDSKQLRESGQAVTRLAGTIFNPPHFRARGSLSWAKGPLNLAATINRAGGIDDTRFSPSITAIPGMTTFDLALRLQPTGGFARGFDLMLAVENAFNAKPSPIRTTSYLDLPYDSTNYTPIGRFVSLTLAKTW